MIEYKVLAGNTRFTSNEMRLTQLTVQVERALNEGWELAGGLFAYTIPDHMEEGEQVTEYYQPMRRGARDPVQGKVGKS